MPPNSVGRLSSLAAIRALTAAVELTDWYLGARVDQRVGEGWRASDPFSAPPLRIGTSNPKIEDSSGFGDKTRKIIVVQETRLSQRRDDFCS
jgi:hypothetical protein